MSGSTLDLVRLDGGDADFAALLAIYQDALPLGERKSAEKVRAMCDAAHYRVTIAKRAAEVVGFSILFLGHDTALLEYMAVRESERGQGCGALLYRRVVEDASPTASRPLIVEIDSEHEASEDQAQRVRRKAFYRRLGCRTIVGLDYLLPLKSASRPPKMELLVDGIDAGEVSKECVATWLIEIYTRVYDQRAGYPQLVEMIASLPPQVRLA